MTLQDLELNGKATLYVRDDLFGTVRRVEVRKLKIEIKPYAQHPEAVWVTFVPKGARKERQVISSHRHYVVVMEGHGHPEPNGLFTRGTQVSDCMRKAQYNGFDARWVGDWINTLTDYVCRTGLRPVFAACDPEFIAAS